MVKTFFSKNSPNFLLKLLSMCDATGFTATRYCSSVQEFDREGGDWVESSYKGYPALAPVVSRNAAAGQKG
jgi:hypothetical protein